MSITGLISTAHGDKPLNVVIVGGSLAGLIQGDMIKLRGHEVHIFEKNLASMRTDHAAGVTTGLQGHEFLQEYDSSHQPYSFPCPGFQILKKNSNIKRLINLSQNLTGWNVLYYRLRANFDGLKSDFCPNLPPAPEAEGEAVYDLDKKVRSVSCVDDRVEVDFDDLINDGATSVDADLVIVADGANSSIRQQFLPGLKHRYSGYVAWRGTVPERDISKDTVKLIEKRFTGYPMKRGYIIGYVMPGANGSFKADERLLNWVWYFNCPEGSQDLEENMTDTDGHRHHNTLLIGKMRPEVWAKLKAHAAEVLEPSFLELITKTTEPFISTVRDGASPQALFDDGRLLIVGEALTLTRPHTGMSFSHAAVNCLLLQKVFQGNLSIQSWGGEVLQYAARMKLQSMVLGEYFQSGVMSRAFLFGLVSWIFVLVRQRLAKVFGPSVVSKGSWQ